MRPDQLALIPEVVREIAPHVPETIKAANPVNWFRDVVSDGRRYKLAVRELKLRYANDRDAYKLALVELNNRKQAYIETLQYNKKVIDTQSKNRQASYNVFFKSIDALNKQSNDILQCILNSRKDIDSDMLNTLIDLHKSYFEQMRQLFQDMGDQMDKEHERQINSLFNMRLQNTEISGKLER